MAVTVTPYNHTVKLFANGQVTLSALRFMLLNGHSFNATHTNISSISGQQVSGNGWTSGGEPIASAAVTVVTTNDAMLDGNDITVTASGGPIGPSDGAVIYDATGSFPLFYVAFGASHTADATADFAVTFNASGIATWTVT